MSEKSLAKRLAEATRPAMTQVAPGKYVPCNPDHIPDVTLATYSENGDGTYRCVPFEDRMVAISRGLVQRLGFQGQWNTLLRLGRAGFVEIVKVSPQCQLINLTSWFNHLRRCAEDPEFWDREENREEYRRAL